jgi:hypothetical protein
MLKEPDLRDLIVYFTARTGGLLSCLALLLVFGVGAVAKNLVRPETAAAVGVEGANGA